MDVFAVPKECSRNLVQIQLPSPQDGNLQPYIHDEHNLALFEMIRHHDSHRSWFMDNHFAKEGRFTMLSKVDPLFLMIPHIRKATEGGQFRTLNDICTSFAQESIKGSARLENALSPDMKWHSICDTKELDGDLFVRYNDQKTLQWLLEKHSRTMEALRAELGAKPSKATLISHANDLISMYLSADLANRFRAAVSSKLKT